MALRYRKVCDLVLYELYWFMAEPYSTEGVQTGIIYELMSDETSHVFFETAVDYLKNGGYVVVTGALPETIGITGKGVSYVDNNIDDINSFLSGVHQQRLLREQHDIPAAGRYVELDHNKKEYKDAINAADQLMEAVRASNKYRDMDDADREQRLTELDAGYRLLNANRVNPTAVKAILFGVLTYLAAKFADEPIGELAKHAWSTLKKLLGID